MEMASSASQMFAESKGGKEVTMAGSQEIDVIQASLLDNCAHPKPRGALVRAKKLGSGGEAAQMAGRDAILPRCTSVLVSGSDDGHELVVALQCG